MRVRHLAATKGRLALLALALVLVLLVVLPLPVAQAWDCPITNYDCQNPEQHPYCTGTNITPTPTYSYKKWTEMGWLELRYKTSPCRHVWARITLIPDVNGVFYVRAIRITSPFGDTDGYNMFSSSPVYWSRMLNDAGHLAVACGYVNEVPTCTSSY
jgi:hypothetical protein